MAFQHYYISFQNHPSIYHKWQRCFDQRPSRKQHSNYNLVYDLSCSQNLSCGCELSLPAFNPRDPKAKLLNALNYSPPKFSAWICPLLHWKLLSLVQPPCFALFLLPRRWLFGKLQARPNQQLQSLQLLQQTTTLGKYSRERNATTVHCLMMLAECKSIGKQPQLLLWLVYSRLPHQTWHTCRINFCTSWSLSLEHIMLNDAESNSSRVCSYWEIMMRPRCYEALCQQACSPKNWQILQTACISCSASTFFPEAISNKERPTSKTHQANGGKGSWGLFILARWLCKHTIPNCLLWSLWDSILQVIFFPSSQEAMLNINDMGHFLHSQVLSMTLSCITCIRLSCLIRLITLNSYLEKAWAR